MQYDLKQIQEKYAQKEKLKYIFFWKPSSENSPVNECCLGQWQPCRFTVDGIEYTTAEQYMMAQKALLFGDTEVFEQIMLAGSPREFKALGRKVKHFDEKIWKENRCGIVIKGNTAKFSQNEKFKEYLLSTEDKILVEASPLDRIWGIGISKENPDAQNPLKWRGTNYLGFCLMEVRDIIKNCRQPAR